MTERNIVGKNRKPQRGYVLVTVAGLLVVLLGFTALAVDVGIMFSARTQLQEAADAAALSGAFTFINSPNAVQPDTAILTARRTAMANKMMGDSIASGDVTVDVPWPATVTGIDRVTVSITHLQSSFFAKAVGANSVTV